MKPIGSLGVAAILFVQLDAAHIGAIGGSAGGHLTALLAVRAQASGGLNP